MKVFQVISGFCFVDVTAIHPTVADTIGKYPQDVCFAEAPDYVYEGWGYDGTKDGDARFIEPTPPEGWYYNSETGGFAMIDPPELIPDPEPETPWSQMSTAYEEGVNEA